MPIYAYEAQTPSGELIADQLDAASVSAAIQELEARGLAIRSIRTLMEEPAGAAHEKAPAFYERIEAALAHRQALITALEALTEDMATKQNARDFRQLIAELRRGATAKDFIGHESAAVWLPLILRSPAATIGGDGFRQVMVEAAHESDKRTMRRRMLAYPVTVLAVAILLGFVLLYAVVPSFGAMYREFQVQLPAPTGTVIWLSEQLRASPFVFFAAIILVGLLAYASIRLWTRHGLTTKYFGSWIAGNSLSVAAMARFTGTLGELLALDAPLPDAIQIAGRASQHPYYRAAAEELAHDARSGKPAWSTSPVARAFPGNVIYALSVHHEGGAGVPLLRELSSLYSDRISERFDWSAGIVGPLTIAAAGILVAFFVLALLLPLISMFGSLA